MVLSSQGARDAATLTVALAGPWPGSSYYLKAFADAAGTTPDGAEVQVQDGAHAGTGASPFVFTWPYAAQSPPIHRWFAVEVDPDGSGPTARVVSALVGPLTLGEWVLHRQLGLAGRPCHCARCGKRGAWGDGALHRLRCGGQRTQCHTLHMRPAAVPARLLGHVLFASRRARGAAAQCQRWSFRSHPDHRTS